MANLWLFKQEPGCYSYDDLERDGVSNALARKHLRSVKRGDRVLFYHTGKEKAVVGEMKVIGGSRPDPKSDDRQSVVVEVRAVRRWEKPVSLAQIKGDKSFSGWDLIRMPRLSVVPVSEKQWQRLEVLAELRE